MTYPKVVLKSVEKSDIIEIDPARLVDVIEDGVYHQVRMVGVLGGKAVCLDNCYDWVLAIDGLNILAIPLKKQ